MKRPLKRSNAPIFWGLFGAGGMLAALIGPALVFLTGIAVPTGLLLPRGSMNYAAMLAFARHPLGKGFIFVVIALFLWHAAHRLYHSLHDIGVRGGTLARLLTYGLAAAGTLIALVALLAIGF